MYGELRQTLLKAKDSNVDTKKGDFEKAIQQDTEILMLEFKKMLGDFNANIAPIFELPDLVNLFQSLNVQTGKIPLRFRGDGVQAKLIPEILNFISVKEQALTSKKLNQDRKQKNILFGDLKNRKILMNIKMLTYLLIDLKMYLSKTLKYLSLHIHSTFFL